MARTITNLIWFTLTSITIDPRFFHFVITLSFLMMGIVVFLFADIYEYSQHNSLLEQLCMWALIDYNAVVFEKDFMKSGSAGVLAKESVFDVLLNSDWNRNTAKLLFLLLMRLWTTSKCITPN